MPQHIDKERVHASFLKSLYSYNHYARVQASMADELIYRLRGLTSETFDTALEIGSGTGFLTERFLKSFQVKTLYTNDLVKECQTVLADIFKQYPHNRCHFLPGDIEGMTDLPARFDLIFSGAAFQWLNDFAGLLPRLKHALTSEGILAFSTFGPYNLQEIRNLTGNSLQYAPFQEIVALVAEHFEVLFTGQDIISLPFSSPRQVLKHLRLTGVNGLSKQQWTKSKLYEFEQRYWELCDTDQQVTLTYHPIFCIARA